MEAPSSKQLERGNGPANGNFEPKHLKTGEGMSISPRPISKESMSPPPEDIMEKKSSPLSGREGGDEASEDYDDWENEYNASEQINESGYNNSGGPYGSQTMGNQSSERQP